MRIKTSELQGVTLDYAVALCEGNLEWACLPYVTGWAFAGPIIERQIIALNPIGDEWFAEHYAPYQEYATAYGRTPLVAAMRCYVASKLGDNVEIPDQLLEQ